MQGVEAVVLGSLSSSNLSLTLNLSSLGILSNLSPWDSLALRTNIFISAIPSKVTHLATLVACIGTLHTFTHVIPSTLWALRISPRHWTLIFVKSLIRKIGPLPLWLLTTITLLVETTFKTRPLQIPHSPFTKFPIFHLLHISHKSREIHLCMEKSGLTLATNRLT